MIVNIWRWNFNSRRFRTAAATTGVAERKSMHYFASEKENSHGSSKVNFRRWLKWAFLAAIPVSAAFAHFNKNEKEDVINFVRRFVESFGVPENVYKMWELYGRQKYPIYPKYLKGNSIEKQFYQIVSSPHQSKEKSKF